MKLNQTEPLLLADVLSDWLSHKEGAAVAMMERLNHVKAKDDDVYTIKQKAYARHLLSAIRWLKTQIPKRWRDILILNEFAYQQVLIQEALDKGESDKCQSSKPLPTCSPQGPALLPSNSLEARQNSEHL